jgi:ERF superfamily
MMTEKQAEFQINDKRLTARTIEPEFKAPAVQATPMDIMMTAVQRGMGKDQLEVLERMFEFDLKVKAQQAKEAYHKAMAAFKANPPKIWRDLQAKYQVTGKPETKWNHADLGTAADAINKALGEHGLNAGWRTEPLENGNVKVTCIITHALGHSESTPLIAGPDKSGGKNDIQAVGSTVFYLERYTLFAITGLAPAHMDDDGQSLTEQSEVISEDNVKIINQKLERIYGKDPSLFFTWTKSKFSVEAVKDIKVKDFKIVMKALSDIEADQKKNAKSNKREPGQEG